MDHVYRQWWYSALGFQDDPGYPHLPKLSLFFFSVMEILARDWSCLFELLSRLTVHMSQWHSLSRCDTCWIVSAASTRCGSDGMTMKSQSQWHRQLNTCLKVTIGRVDIGLLSTNLEPGHTWLMRSVGSSIDIIIYGSRLYMCTVYDPAKILFENCVLGAHHARICDDRMIAQSVGSCGGIMHRDSLCAIFQLHSLSRKM